MLKLFVYVMALIIISIKRLVEERQEKKKHLKHAMEIEYIIAQVVLGAKLQLKVQCISSSLCRHNLAKTTERTKFW